MRPVWYKINEIPYETMWIDDAIWLPIILSDKNINGFFLLEGETTILDYTLSEISEEELKKKQKEIINFDLE